MAKHEISRAVLEDALNQADVELRENYSGRGMYGDTCIGVVGEHDELENFERELAKAATLDKYKDHHPTDYSDPEAVVETFIEELDAIAGQRRSDSMGMSSIYYYPRLTITED